MRQQELAAHVMGPRSRGIFSVAVLGVVVIATTWVGSAFASRVSPGAPNRAHAIAHVAVLPPALGVWKSQNLGSSPGQGNEMIGSFTVISGEYVTNLHGKLTNNVESSCGTGTITVPGKIKIIHGTGQDSYGPFNLYAAGTINPSRDPIVQPLRMVVIHNGKRVTGSVELSFVWPPKKGYLTGGEIDYGACSVSLAFLHA